MNILHLAPLSPIIDNFFPFLDANLDCTGHKVFILSKKKSNLKLNKIELIGGFGGYKLIINLFIYLNKSDKIIIHGLFGWKLTFLLSLNPWLLKRCYWVIWGGDLYYHKLRVRNFKSNLYEIIRTFVIKRIGHFVTYIKGDYELAQQWYGASGQYHECLMYTSNIFKELVIPPKTGSVINILVGNSGDPTNNHLDVFEKLLSYKNENLMIYCPLSYGGIDDGYAIQIAKKGSEMFGDKFVALIDFMPFAEYLKFLGQIDIAIFAHKRQQAMGNTITLLGLGKKVYIRSDVTPWKLFDDLDIRVFDFSMFDLSKMSDELKNKNIIRVKDFFSKTTMFRQWGNVFKD